MIFFNVSTYKGSNVELFINKASGQIGVMYDGQSVGCLPKAETQEIVQYLVNHDHVDLDELKSGKQAKDSDPCTCKFTNGGARFRDRCPKHFIAA